MPYDLPFSRIVEVDNGSALELNKVIAAKLIIAHPEIYDLNHVESGGHFSKQEIDSLDEDFPDKHFTLHAEVGDVYLSFQFWKDTLWLELGSCANVPLLFAHVRDYAAFIIQQGLVPDVPPESGAMTLDERIAWHMQEYREWIGFVKHVRKYVANQPPTID